jgi:hypothetical protein
MTNKRKGPARCHTYSEMRRTLFQKTVNRGAISAHSLLLYTYVCSFRRFLRGKSNANAIYTTKTFASKFWVTLWHSEKQAMDRHITHPVSYDLWRNSLSVNVMMEVSAGHHITGLNPDRSRNALRVTAATGTADDERLMQKANTLKWKGLQKKLKWTSCG